MIYTDGDLIRADVEYPGVLKDRYIVFADGDIYDTEEGCSEEVCDRPEDDGIPSVCLLGPDHRHHAFHVEGIVAHAFCPDYPKNTSNVVVYHLDGDIDNNDYRNLSCGVRNHTNATTARYVESDLLDEDYYLYNDKNSSTSPSNVYSNRQNSINEIHLGS